jgi:hypothetical protein
MRSVPGWPVGAAEMLGGYYRSSAVRARIDEYAAGADARASAWSLAGWGGRNELAELDGAPVACPRHDLWRLLADGADVCRSLADTGGTLLQLDVDYSHPSDPAEPYRDPATCFRRLEPVHRAACAAFGRRGVRPLVLMTGRGYHITARAPRRSRLHDGLQALGRISAGVRARCQGMAAVVPGATSMSEAHDGAGRLLEQLCHEVVSEVAGRTEVPVALADLRPPDGGPFVCLDLSSFGDPLFARYARCAFSGNQKAGMRRLAASPPFVLVIPRMDEPLEALLRARQDPVLSARMAASSSVCIPETADDVGWLDSYRGSALAAFHRDFDGGPRADPATWSYTYDALDLTAVPPCVAATLQEPNPALLDPVRLRALALVLRALGWHPRSIAALVTSRYEQDHRWGSMWWRYDRETRAAFYVRLLLASADRTGDAAELSCAMQKRRGACPAGGACGFQLERLGPRRPFV